MKATAVPVAVSSAAFLLGFAAAAQELSSGRWIDLTHPFNAESVYWPTADMFEKETVFEGQTEGATITAPTTSRPPSMAGRILMRRSISPREPTRRTKSPSGR